MILKKNLNSNIYQTNKISSISAIILSGLVFKEYYSNFSYGLKELKKLRTKKLGPVQLKKAKQQLIGQLAIAQENNCNLMQSNAKSYQAFGKVASVEETKEKIMAITAEDLQEVAKEIFREEQLSTIIYEPKDL